jgi:mannosyltransferase OCH1-like enzyme
MKMHRIWLGGNMPVKYQEYGALWSELNPEYELVDWNEEMILDVKWENQDVLDVMYKESKQPGADLIAFYTHVADVVDYELIYKYGGWYFNTDMYPIRSLSVLNINEKYPALAMEDDVHPVNMAMYSPMDHAFFAKVIELLPKRYFSMPGAYMNATTGVQLLQQALLEYGRDRGVGLLPRNIFNPIHWADFDYGADAPVDREYPPETVAVHEWLHRTNQRGQRILET